MILEPYLSLLGLSLGLRLGMANSHQVTESDVLHWMAGGAYVLVHLVAAADAKQKYNKNSYSIEVACGSHNEDRSMTLRSEHKQQKCGSTYLAWSNDAMRPLWLQGCDGGCASAPDALIDFSRA